ncbi:hypothetical protein H5410_030891 [Solanum commersonii]|uniref:Uncharacterized protein n=1 Tax=Solanum commersonii TaxID=4109 RepID=A0A9J5YGY9_SOLCO|nr:hypothetical protein H5410_030891 [Solanum commersonii]
MYIESDPVPLQIDISSQEEDMEANATEWVQANMLNLSQLFGVDLKGCRKEAHALFMKLDQREKENGLGESQKVTKENNIVPKEIRNLFFNVNFKDAEPRSSGSTLTLKQ